MLSHITNKYFTPFCKLTVVSTFIVLLPIFFIVERHLIVQKCQNILILCTNRSLTLFKNSKEISKRTSFPLYRWVSLSWWHIWFPHKRTWRVIDDPKTVVHSTSIFFCVIICTQLPLPHESRLVWDASLAHRTDGYLRTTQQTIASISIVYAYVLSSAACVVMVVLLVCFTSTFCLCLFVLLEIFYENKTS